MRYINLHFTYLLTYFVQNRQPSTDRQKPSQMITYSCAKLGVNLSTGNSVQVGEI